FWLIHLTVAQERPDVLVRRVLDAAHFEVLVKACLVNGVNWSQTHGYGREFPEPIHTVWVWVGRHTLAWAAGDFLTETVEVIFIQTAFHVRTCVHAGGGVALEEDLVAARRIVLAPEEVVKANFIQRC